MAKKTASDTTPPVEMTVELDGSLATARVTYNGQPVDAEVQWFSGTPFRPAPGGVAVMEYQDPRQFALSRARYAPPRSMAVMARVEIGPEQYEYSDTCDLQLN